VVGLSCVAAPLHSEAGDVIAAISLSVPTYRFMGEEDGYVRMITGAARRISRRLGYTNEKTMEAA
jgi:DNA-binding IclR family transcriptional regulator